ncbi:glycosyltransferase [Arthrobacter sp. CDRTa11]|uniref:glycosyltransferase n=1 Tax=Arthrobacter sp. CDRTa11 TaxID=2651199 RepID=UPI002265965A|nr:glycosyltransferase [Arthrobacter sp. CDRTa11]
MNCTFVIPARNEADRIGNLLSVLRRALNPEQVLVVDNGSTDGTGAIARRSGARVIYEPRRGKGYAVDAGVQHTQTDLVFLCDADIERFDFTAAEVLLENRIPGEILARLALDRAPELAPVTYLCAQPLLKTLGFQKVSEPLGGLALVARSFLSNTHLPGHWGFDVALTMAALQTGVAVRELPVRNMTHRAKPLTDYKEMATDVGRTILQSAGLLPWDHVDCVRCSRVKIALDNRAIDSSERVEVTRR